MACKIKITYIPDNDKVKKNLAISLDETLDLYDGETPTDMALLINAHTMGISLNDNKNSIFDILQDKREYVSADNLIEKIQSSIKLNKKILVLNGYDLSLTYIKDNLYPLIKDKGIVLAINIMAKDKELKINSTHEYEFPDNETPTDKDWENMANEIEEHYEEDKKKKESAAAQSVLDMLLKLFNNSEEDIDDELDDDDNDDDDISVQIFEYDPDEGTKVPLTDILKPKASLTKSKQKTKLIYEVESHSHCNEEDGVFIDVYSNDTVEISNMEGDSVTIDKKFIPFLAEWLINLEDD